MASWSDLNVFDKFCNIWPQNVTMEKIAGLALTGKVILSYKIDSLSSFHDQLIKGLWKRSSNGYLYPLDNCCEKLLYVEINDNFEAEAAKSMEKLRNSSVTAKVFDEMAKPILSSSRNLVASSVVDTSLLSDRKEVEVVVDNIVCEPSLSSSKNLLVLDEGDNSSRYDLDKHQVSVDDILERRTKGDIDTSRICNAEVNAQSSEKSGQFFRLMVKSPATLGCELECYLVEEIQRPNAQEVLDKMLLHDSTLEFAPTANISQDDSVEYDPTLMSSVDHAYQDNTLMYDRMMFSKLGTLNASYFRDLVIIGANGGRFSKFRNVLFRDCHFSYHIPQVIEGLCHGNLRHEHPQFHVKTRPFTISHDIYSMNFIQNVLCHLLSNDMSWFRGSSLSTILDVDTYRPTVLEVENYWMPFLNFKEVHSWGKRPLFCCGYGALEGDIFIMFVTYTLEDKGDFRGEEYKAFVIYTQNLFNVVVLWRKCIFGRTNNGALLLITYLFYPGGLCWVYDLCNAHFLMEKGGFRSQEMGYSHYESGLNYTNLILVVIGIRCWFLIVYPHGLICTSESVSSLWLHTRVFALWKITCTMKFDVNNLTARYDILMSMADRSFIFDPGVDWHLLVYQNGLAYGQKLLCVYDETLCSTVGNVSKVHGLLFHSLKENLRSVIECFNPGIICEKMRKSTLLHFEAVRNDSVEVLWMMCTEKCGGYYLTTSCNILMSATPCHFIFDPAGNNFLVQMNTTRVLQRVQASERESVDLTVVWVFDPGGKYSLVLVASADRIMMIRVLLYVCFHFRKCVMASLKS